MSSRAAGRLGRGADVWALGPRTHDQLFSSCLHTSTVNVSKGCGPHRLCMHTSSAYTIGTSTTCEGCVSSTSARGYHLHTHINSRTYTQTHTSVHTGNTPHTHTHTHAHSHPTVHTGTTTTCESLFMGVPCISLSGDCHAYNVGVSLLAATGLEKVRLFVVCVHFYVHTCVV